MAERQAEQQVEMVEAISEGIEFVQAEDAGDLEDSRTLGVWELHFWELHFWGFLDRLDLRSEQEGTIKEESEGLPLEVQWLRIHLPMQER